VRRRAIADPLKNLFARDADVAQLDAELASGETKRNFEAMSKEELVAHSLMVRRLKLNLYWTLRRKRVTDSMGENDG